jgi:hypothetical protein
MAITYRDNKSAKPKRAVSVPVLAVIVAIGGLLLLSPQTTSMLEDTVAMVLRLPGN